MEAVMGDRIVVAAAMLDGPVRHAEIIDVGMQGGPPYLLRSDDGREMLFFPGPDAHISHHESLPEPPAAAETPANAAAASAARPHSQVENWRVELCLFEQDAATMAHAVLHTDACRGLDSRGEAHRNPSEADVPEIGERVAAARALRRMADRLLGGSVSGHRGG